MKQISIGITGFPGSGKTEVARYLSLLGFQYISLSDFIKKDLGREGIHTYSRKILQDRGNELRKKFGPDILARYATKYIQHGNFKKVVIEGLRNIHEIEYFQTYEHFTLIGVEAPQDIRYKRCVKEKGKKAIGTYEKFLQEEKRESHLGNDDIGLRVEDCLRKAQNIIYNTESIYACHREIDKILHHVYPEVNTEDHEKKFHLIIIGPPGAGKSTQARLLAEQLDIPWLSIGELLREAYKNGLSEGVQWWNQYGKKGLNAPISLKFKILEKRLLKAKNGFVLDDFPRTEEDLNALTTYLKESKKTIDYVILLDVAEKTSMYRILKRWEIGKKRGIERYDDSPYIIKVRIREGYKKELPIILNFFKRNYRFVRIDGNGKKTTGEINKNIRQVIGVL